MSLRRLGLYCALAISPFAFLAGCSPTAGVGASPSAFTQSIIGVPIPKVGPTSIPIASTSERGAQDIIGWPGIIGGMSIIGSPVVAPTSSPVITLNNNRAR